MAFCSIRTCVNNRVPNPEVGLYTLPEDLEELALWVKAFDLKVVTRDSRICGLHFRTKYFLTKPSSVCLKNSKETDLERNAECVATSGKSSSVEQITGQGIPKVSDASTLNLEKYNEQEAKTSVFQGLCSEMRDDLSENLIDISINSFIKQEPMEVDDDINPSSKVLAILEEPKNIAELSENISDLKTRSEKLCSSFDTASEISAKITIKSENPSEPSVSCSAMYNESQSIGIPKNFSIKVEPESETSDNLNVSSKETAKTVQLSPDSDSDEEDDSLSADDSVGTDESDSDDSETEHIEKKSSDVELNLECQEELLSAAQRNIHSEDWKNFVSNEKASTERRFLKNRNLFSANQPLINRVAEPSTQIVSHMSNSNFHPQIASCRSTDISSKVVPVSSEHVMVTSQQITVPPKQPVFQSLEKSIDVLKHHMDSNLSVNPTSISSVIPVVLEKSKECLSKSGNYTSVDEEILPTFPRGDKGCRVETSLSLCIECSKPAVIFCCLNTNYCSQGCQAKHWEKHKISCAKSSSPAVPQESGSSKVLPVSRISEEMPLIIEVTSEEKVTSDFLPSKEPKCYAPNLSETNISQVPEKTLQHEQSLDDQLSIGPVIVGVVSGAEGFTEYFSTDCQRFTFSSISQSKDNAAACIQNAVQSSPISLPASAVADSIYSLQKEIPLITSGKKNVNNRNLLCIKIPSCSQRLEKADALRSKLKEENYIFSVWWLYDHNFLPLTAPCATCGKKKFSIRRDERCFNGYSWVCKTDFCKSKDPVKRPKFFENFLFYSFEQLLLLTYHWACQSDLEEIMKDVNLDFAKISDYFMALREFCKEEMDNIWSLSGFEIQSKVETYAVRLGNFFVLGIYNRKTCYSHLEILPVEVASRTSQHIHILGKWLSKGDVLISERKIDDNYLKDIQKYSADPLILDAANPGSHVLNISTYLQKHLTNLFGELRHDQLDQNLIKGFLSELLWRERHGTPEMAFWRIVSLMFPASDSDGDLGTSDIAVDEFVVDIHKDLYERWGPSTFDRIDAPQTSTDQDAKKTNFKVKENAMSSVIRNVKTEQVLTCKTEVSNSSSIPIAPVKPTLVTIPVAPVKPIGPTLPVVSVAPVKSDIVVCASNVSGNSFMCNSSHGSLYFQTMTLPSVGISSVPPPSVPVASVAPVTIPILPITSSVAGSVVQAATVPTVSVLPVASPTFPTVAPVSTVPFVPVAPAASVMPPVSVSTAPSVTVTPTVSVKPPVTSTCDFTISHRTNKGPVKFNLLRDSLCIKPILILARGEENVTAATLLKIKIYFDETASTLNNYDREGNDLGMELKTEGFFKSPIQWLVSKGFVRKEVPCESCDDKAVVTDNPRDPDGCSWMCTNEKCGFDNKFKRPPFFALFSLNMAHILAIIYHWATQTDARIIISAVHLDPEQILSVRRRLQELCTLTIKEKIDKLGGENAVVEVGMAEFGNFFILAALDRKSRWSRMQAFEKSFISSDTIGYILKSWLAAKSCVVINSTQHFDMLDDVNIVFANPKIKIRNDPNFHILNVTCYLQKYLKSMFVKFKAQDLTLETLQIHLYELMWRERFGRIPKVAFWNIMTQLITYGRKGHFKGDITTCLLDVLEVSEAEKSSVSSMPSNKDVQVVLEKIPKDVLEKCSSSDSSGEKQPNLTGTELDNSVDISAILLLEKDKVSRRVASENLFPRKRYSKRSLEADKENSVPGSRKNYVRDNSDVRSSECDVPETSSDIEASSPYIRDMYNVDKMFDSEENECEADEEKSLVNERSQSSSHQPPSQKFECIECKQFVTSDHFSRVYRCDNCKKIPYSTFCPQAFFEHRGSLLFGKRMPRRSKQATWSPKSIILEESWYCVCGFATKEGNKLASHLVECKKETCYLASTS